MGFRSTFPLVYTLLSGSILVGLLYSHGVSAIDYKDALTKSILFFDALDTYLGIESHLAR